MDWEVLRCNDWRSTRSIIHVEAQAPGSGNTDDHDVRVGDTSATQALSIAGTVIGKNNISVFESVTHLALFWIGGDKRAKRAKASSLNISG